MKTKIISISGSPGVGKTKVAELLSKNLHANLISIKKLIEQEKIPYTLDKERKTKEVDPKDVQLAANRHTKKNKINIIEGHLSHLLESDLVIVLRANPIILKKRLKKRKWPGKKIDENIKAEILDSTTIEAVGKHGRRKVLEIDTSDKTAKQTVDIIKKILNNYHSKKNYSAGKINWTTKYIKMLVR